MSRVRPVLAAALLVLLAATVHAAPSGLAGRVIVGYQGWFGCPGDYLDNKEWQHWFEGAAGARALTVDMLPSLKSFKREDLCDTGLKRADGSAVHVFSSQNPAIVARHFEWLQKHGIDGVAFQRFVTHTQLPDLRKRSDNVLGHVRQSAERTGRVFYVTYDVSGSDAATVLDAIRADWKHLTGTLGVTRSTAYLNQAGKPVLQLWGFGFKDRPGSADAVARLVSDLKSGAAGLTAATVIGGVPTGWRTLTADSRGEPEWAKLYRSFDVISPWAVGRFVDDRGADQFRRTSLEPDLAETRRLGIGYLPVVFPGFSWRNLMTRRGEPARAILNQIPRRCGDFMWRQVTNAAESGATSLYGAMFDEVDEGTALFELEGSSRTAPAGTPMVGLNQDGCQLPDDWYLSLTGKAARLMRNRAAAQKR